MDTLRSNTRSLEEAREALARAGVSVSAWARANGFKPSTVAAVLRGERDTRLGRSHAVAVALRVKDGVVVVDPREV